MMTLTRAPRSPFGSLFEDLFSEVFQPKSSDRTPLAPRLNVAETDKAYVLSFEMPGIDKDAVQIEIDGDELSVSGERHLDKESPEGAEFRRIEHRYGSFQRRLTLPQDIDRDAIDARHERGVLTVTVPKTAPTQTRKIAIQGE